MKDNPNHKGNVAELAIAAAATKLGVDVSKPLGEHTRYDLIFGIGGQLLRVQCKWAPLQDNVIKVNLASSRYRSDGQQITKAYTSDEIDAFVVYCEALDRCYWLPIASTEGVRTIWLRTGEARNGQRAAVNWAEDFDLSGAVAQLEVALRWQRRGRRFESDQLHSPSTDDEVVGAHEFRNLFGLFMQRAHAGERFLVTRRGKPYARLIPAVDQPELLPLDAQGREPGAESLDAA